MEIQPQAPKNGIFQKKSFFWKGPQISLPTSPQPPPDIKSKSSYARKRDFGLLCPNMEIRPQAPKNGIFQKIFIFLKRSSNFASNEPSTSQPRVEELPVLHLRGLCTFYTTVISVPTTLPTVSVPCIYTHIIYISNISTSLIKCVSTLLCLSGFAILPKCSSYSGVTVVRYFHINYVP